MIPITPGQDFAACLAICLFIAAGEAVPGGRSARCEVCR